MRELEPGTAMYSPEIYVDGRPIGQSSQSTMFYHDVAAGQHVFDVENCMQTQGLGAGAEPRAGWSRVAAGDLSAGVYRVALLSERRLLPVADVGASGHVDRRADDRSGRALAG